MANKDNVELQIRAKNLTKEAFDKVSEALKLLEDDADRASKKTKLSFREVAGGVTVAAGAITAVSATLVELGSRGSDIGDVKDHFQTLTAAIGENADVMLGQLRGATLNTISDFELLKTVNFALGQGLKVSSAQLARIGDIAAVTADRVGGDTKESFDLLMKAITTGNDKLLKQIGLNIDAQAAQQAYADSIGKTVNKLTEQEKIQATANAILAEGERVLAQSGKAQADFGDQVAQNKTRLRNFVDGISEWVATTPAIENFASTVTMASGTVTGLGVVFGPVRTGVEKLLPLLGVSGGLAGMLGGVGKVLGFLVSGPVAAFVATAVGAWSLGTLIAKFTNLDEKIEGLAIRLGLFNDIAAETAGAQQDTINLAIQRGAAATVNYTEAIKFNQEWLQKQIETTRAAAQATQQDTAESERAKAVANALAAAKRAAAEGAKQYRDELALLGTEGKQTVRTLLAQGQSASEIAAAFRGIVSEGTIERYAEQIRDAAKAEKDLKEAAEKRAKVLQDALYAANDDARRQAADILKKQEEDHYKSIERQNDRYMKGLAIVAEAEAEAGDLRRQRTMSDYDYKVDLLMRQEAAERKQLEALGMATEENLAAVAAKYGEKMAVAREAHNDELARMKAATNSWGNLTSKWLDSIPGLLQQAFTGGGGFSGAMKGLLSGIGGDVFGKMFEGPNGLGNKVAQGISGLFGKSGLGAKLGSLVGGLGGPIGSLLGGLATKGISKLFGSIFGGSKERKENAAATNQVKEMGNELVKTYGSMDNLRTLGKMTGIDIAGSFGHQGKKGLEQFTKDVEAFKKKLGEVSAKFNGELSGILGQAEGMGYRLPETLTPYFDKLREMGVISEENAALMAGFGDSSVVDFKKMEEAAGRYGISLDSLGGAFNQASINDAARQILEDYDLLTRGGADVGAVIHGMADEVSELAQRSMRLGVSMPENMREIAAHLIANGELLDENGEKITDINKLSFGDPIKVGLERISTLLESLVKGFGFALPQAMAQVPTDIDVTVDVTERRHREYVDGDYQTSNGGDYSVPGAAAGGLFTKPTFRVFAEKQPEVAGSPNAIVDAFAEAMRKTGMGGGAGAQQIVNINALDTDSVRRSMRTTLLPELKEAILQNRDGIRTELREALGIN